jgi:PAS domain S-box-containing protein
MTGTAPIRSRRASIPTRARVVAGVLLCVPCSALRAQVGPGLDPRLPISQYVHDVWTIDQGLPQSSVLAIAQGSDGYLWLATEAGVVRFDGVAFTTFNTANTPALRDNYVNTLLVDRADTVWAGTWVGGVTRLCGDTALPAPGGGGSRVDALYQDRAGTIWEGRDAGLARWRGGRFVAVPGLDTMVEAIAEAADGTLLLGTERGVRALRQGRVVPWQPAGGRITGPVWTIYRDAQGGLWFGTPDALYHAADGKLRRFTTRDGLPAGGVTTVLATRRGQVWAGTGGGIARLVGERWEAYTTSDGLSDNSVNDLLEDREGSLWVGTSLGGLNRFRQPLLILYTTRQGLSANATWSVNGDGRGDMWIGTGGGLDLLRRGRVTASSGPGAPRSTVYASIRTRDGDLWAATRSGLDRLHHGRWERLGKPFPPSHVSAFLEDSTGALWIGGYAGLFRWQDGRLRDLTGAAGLTHVEVTALVPGRDGSLWIGTHGRGLLRYRDGRFTRMAAGGAGAAGGGANEAVEAVAVDRHGVWAGTPAGLDLVRGDSLILVPLASTVLMTDIYQILEDDAGYLWLSSNEGLARVSERQLLDAASGRAGRAEAEQIVPLDGRGRIEFNGGSQYAGWRGPDGHLWFTSIKGLVDVDPAHLASNPVPPAVHIERLLVNGRPVEPAAGLVLPPGSGTLEAQYTATSLLIPERVTFRYRLAGYDDDWVDAGNRRVAYFTHVPGGHYRFEVIAANNDGVWNRRGAVLPFSIAPYFYQTWWFYSLAVLAALAATYGVFRFRVRRVERAAQQLSELVDERTGELRREVAERRRAEERYRHLFDANPQPVWVNDRENLAFLAVNDAAVRHYGYTREEFLGLRLGDLQAPEEQAGFPEWIRAAGDGWRGTGTWHQRTKDGAVIEVEVAAQALAFAGRPAALVVAADVTARRELEERLQQAQKMEAVGQLAGGIAHELNNVLTAVMARVDLAVAALPADAGPIADLTQAQASAHRGAGMIRKLLGFSRRERLVLKPLQLERLTGELAETVRRMLPERLEVAMTAEADLPAVVADAGAVQHILLNLATNARDAIAEHGRIAIAVRRATPEEERRAAEDWGGRGRHVVLSVSDDGCGMDAQTVARVFEPYFSTKSREQGAGLGMAMVYGLMKQQRGFIQVSSRPGAGTDVLLYFPAMSDPAPAAVAPAPPAAREGGDRTILVVEDEAEVRSAATRALTRFGYRVLSAADGEEGLRAWRASRETIDLVFSDAIMPRMGGLALYQEMSRERPGIRFLLTSGFTGEEVRDSGPTAADLPFLAKPWTLDELRAAVRGALEGGSR